MESNEYTAMPHIRHGTLIYIGDTLIRCGFNIGISHHYPKTILSTLIALK